MSGQGEDKPIPLRSRRKCPNCGRPAARDSYPFCSSRCADIDLNRWFSGAYVIPGEDIQRERWDPDDE